MTIKNATLLSRRSFLEFVLSTIPACALPGGALAGAWPSDELERDVAEPWVLALSYGTELWDPSDADGALRVPSLREWISDSYPGLAERGGVGEREAMQEYLVNEGFCDEDEDLREALKGLRKRLDTGLDSDLGDFEQWLETECKSAAWTTWTGLPEEVQNKVGLSLVEGDHPGSSCTYIRWGGTLPELNDALLQAGVNIHVIDEDKPDELLFPGDPKY